MQATNLLDSVLTTNVVVDFNQLSSFDVSVTDSNEVLSSDILFHYDNDKYVVLENHNITNDTDVLKDNLIINADGIVSKIVLTDFPANATYHLSLNNANADASIYDGQCQVFNFEKRHKSKNLDFIIRTAIGFEPVILDRNSYLNMGRIDTIKINAPRTVEFNPVHHIHLHGYFYNRDTGLWKNGIKEITMFIKGAIMIPCNNIIESITLMNHSLSKFKTNFMVSINDECFGPYLLEKCCKLKIRRKDNKYYPEYFGSAQKNNCIVLKYCENFNIIFNEDPEIVPNIVILENQYATRSAITCDITK